MIWTNDDSRIAEAQKDVLKRLLKITIPSYLWAMFTIGVVLKESDTFNFVFFTTLICGLCSLIIGLYLAINRHKKEFYKYKIDIDENSISIFSNLYKLNIKMEEINKITINRYNEITIYYKHTRISISKYLTSNQELQNALNSVKEIEKSENNRNYLEYLSVLFFCGLFLIRYLPDYRLYLVIAAGFVITSVISMINKIISPMKKANLLIMIGINTILVVIVLKNIIEILLKIIKI